MRRVKPWLAGLITLAVIPTLLTAAAPSVNAAARVATAVVTPEPIPTSFTFTGSGYGHGVGMSQYGARGMALAGSTASDIVTHYYSGTTVAAVDDSMVMRVNLLHRVTKIFVRSEALAAGGGGISVTVTGLPAVQGTIGDTFSVVAGTSQVTVLLTRAGVTTTVGVGPSAIFRWSGTRSRGTLGTAAAVANVATTVAGFASTGHRYRYGYLYVAPTVASPTTFEVLNVVRMHDEYLRGIAEVPSSWPTASLQAQVIAARSYALTHVGTGTVHSLCLCNVDDGGGPYYDQVFAGYAKESGAGGALWRAAVLATAGSPTTGQAVMLGAKPVRTYYFSASGGSTQASKDVWGGVLSYAVSVDDHWSMDKSVPWSSWIPRVRTQAQVAAAFGLPDVVRIDLTDRLGSKAVHTAIGYSSTGAQATISGGSLRSRLSLPSAWVWTSDAAV